GFSASGERMRDHYGHFSHPVLDVPAEASTDLFSEMDKVADELRANPQHIPDDDKIAFRDLQKRRRPDLSTAQFSDLFELWKDRYRARQDARAAAVPAKLAALWAERDALFTERASLPEHERAAVTERIAVIAREIADLPAPGCAAVLGLIR